MEEGEYMVSPTQISLHLIDWTDPRKLVKLGTTNSNEEPNSNIHLLLAKDILNEILSSRNSTEYFTFSNTCFADLLTVEDEHKLLCSMLNKLYIPFNTDPEERQVVLQLVKNITEVKWLRYRRSHELNNTGYG